MTIAQQVQTLLTPKISQYGLSVYLGIDRVTLWRKMKNNSFSKRDIKKLKKYGIKENK